MKKFYMTGLAAAISLSLVACSDDAEVAEAEAIESAIDSAFAEMEETAESTMSALCDRDCLIDITSSYLFAIAAHDPSMAPLAEDIAFVENVTPMTPGEGIWQTAMSAPSDFAIYVPDEINQTVGFLGMMTYFDAPPAPAGSSPEERIAFAATAEKDELPLMLALRLKIEAGEIVEAEHLVASIRPEFMNTLHTPRPGLLAEVPENQRMDHDAMITMGASYYDALDDNDGTLMPFAADCERHENGMITAGANSGAGPNNAGSGAVSRECEGQLTSQVMAYITRIENRRVFAADPVTGLVMGLSHFRHAMDTGPYEVFNTDGSTKMQTMDFDPFDLPAGHIFKIGGDGLVHEIEAMGFTTIYNAPTGWE